MEALILLENMYARVRGRIQGKDSRRDNTLIFKGEREEGKRTAGMHEEAVEMGGWVVGRRLDKRHSQA